MVLIRMVVYVSAHQVEELHGLSLCAFPPDSCMRLCVRALAPDAQGKPSDSLNRWGVTLTVECYNTLAGCVCNDSGINHVNFLPHEHADQRSITPVGLTPQA